VSGGRAGKPVAVGDVVIEPIERQTVHVDHVGGVIVGAALKEPVAVVIHTPAGSWRVNLSRPAPGRGGPDQ
jgi:hypothetical protein